MTISPYEPVPGSIELHQVATVDLRSWAIEAGEVYKIAEALARTQFVPKALHGKPDDICAQILYGRDVKLPPMVALQQIHIIEGRPSLSALSMRGMAQANGVKFRHDEMTETRCKMSAMAPGDANWTTVTWTMDRAKKLGLTSKSNWLKQPQAMLIARATSELCRLVAAPLFLGMSYSVEELRDGANDLAQYDSGDPGPEPPPAEEVRTLKRKPVKATATVPPPATDPPVDKPVDESEPKDAPINETTRKTIWDTFADWGLKDRVSRLAYVADVVGREVASINDINEAEAQRVLAHQEQDRSVRLDPPDDGDGPTT